MPSADGILDEIYGSELSRLVSVAKPLVAKDFRSVQDLWKIELAAIDHQVDLRKVIRACKAEESTLEARIKKTHLNRVKNWKGKIARLQKQRANIRERLQLYDHVYNLARRFGDALAWVFLGMNRETILSLSENRPNPPCSRGDALKGVLSVAEILSRNGLGFPIIHDATSILRIGDVSFVSGDFETITVEVKTKVLERSGGTTTAQVCAAAIMNEAQVARWQSAHRQMIGDQNGRDDQPEETQLRPNFNSARFHRQIARMGCSVKSQSAMPGEVYVIDGTRRVRLHASSVPVPHNWEAIIEVVGAAKETGIAARAVDGAFLYIAAYRETPLVVPWVNRFDGTCLDQILNQLPQSGIFFDDVSKNQLFVGSLEHQMSRNPKPHVMPLYLYPFREDVVNDLVSGRMIIVVCANVGKILEAIRNAGYDASLSGDSDGCNSDLVRVNTEFVSARGVKMKAQLYGLGFYWPMITEEFLSLEGFVSFVDAMARAAPGFMPPDGAESAPVTAKPA